MSRRTCSCSSTNFRLTTLGRERSMARYAPQPKGLVGKLITGHRPRFPATGPRPWGVKPAAVRALKPALVFAARRYDPPRSGLPSSSRSLLRLSSRSSRSSRTRRSLSSSRSSRPSAMSQPLQSIPVQSNNLWAPQVSLLKPCGSGYPNSARPEPTTDH